MTVPAAATLPGAKQYPDDLNEDIVNATPAASPVKASATHKGMSNKKRNQKEDSNPPAIKVTTLKTTMENQMSNAINSKRRKGCKLEQQQHNDEQRQRIRSLITNLEMATDVQESRLVATQGQSKSKKPD